MGLHVLLHHTTLVSEPEIEMIVENGYCYQLWPAGERVERQYCYACAALYTKRYALRERF